MTTDEIALRRDEYAAHLRRASITPHTFVRAGMVYELLDLLGAALELHEENRHAFGAESPNGDVVDWLATWIAAPGNQVTCCVLETYLRRAGHKEQADKLRKVNEEMRRAGSSPHAS